jgi:signal transduction histidine kinase
MQIVQQFAQKGAIFFLLVSALLIFFTLFQSFGLFNALATAVVNFGGGLFLVTYIGSTRRARSIQEQQQSLASELKRTHDQLTLYALRLQQLAVGRERQRLARELHDSVTQTIFSMTLATQSALMLLDRDSHQVAVLLDRLAHLTHNALSEMQVLISKLAPENLTEDRFIAALQEHITQRRKLNDLSVVLKVSGSQSLTAMEEQNLFRIVQEGLNNIVKHAGVQQAEVSLQLDGQPCLAIEDHGIGFDPQLIRPGSQMGLVNMKDRAREIGWTLEVASSLGKGTRILVRKDTGG